MRKKRANSLPRHHAVLAQHFSIRFSHYLRTSSRLTWEKLYAIFRNSFWWQIGHFWVPPGLRIKTKLSAQPLIWKWFFIFMQIKLFSTRQVVHLASFWNWRFWEIASGLFFGGKLPGSSNSITRVTLKKVHNLKLSFSKGLTLTVVNYPGPSHSASVAKL